MMDRTYALLSDAIDGMQRMKRSFTERQLYNIHESSKCNTARKNHSIIGTTWNNEMIFEYVGKQGIHHCFKATPGGWSRTYTDYQLIGKKVKEVK